MFDHLDDSITIPSDDRFRSQTLRRGRRLRRRRRVAAGATACGSTLLLGAAGLAWWGKEKVDDIDRVEIAGPTLPDAEPGEPTTFLVVGSDSVGPLEGGDPVTEGRNPESNLADAIMLVRADPTAGHTGLSVLSVPRDLWVEDLDGAGTPGKINQALAVGGPENLVRVVSSTLGVDVHHYVQLDMDGLRDLVDGAGGIDVAFAAPVRDETTGFRAAAACQHLDGEQVLGLVRSRRLQVQQPDGSWELEATSDIGRMARQRALAHLVVGSFLSGDWVSPAGVAGAVDLLADHATIDSELSIPEMISWGEWLSSASVATTRNVDLHVIAVNGPGDRVMGSGYAALELAPGWEERVAGFEAGYPTPPSGLSPEEDQAASAAVAPPQAC